MRSLTDAVDGFWERKGQIWRAGSSLLLFQQVLLSIPIPLSELHFRCAAGSHAAFRLSFHASDQLVKSSWHSSSLSQLYYSVSSSMIFIDLSPISENFLKLESEGKKGVGHPCSLPKATKDRTTAS